MDLNTIASPNQTKKQIFVSTLDQQFQRKLAGKLESRCFELAKQILDLMPMCNYGQIEMALAVIKFVRLEAGIINRTSEQSMETG